MGTRERKAVCYPYVIKWALSGGPVYVIKYVVAAGVTPPQK